MTSHGACTRAGVFNPLPTDHLRPSGEFCAAREGYFIKYNELWILKLESLDHGCANHATQGKRFSSHPLLWRNEATLLVQWRTLNACFCTQCAVCAAVSASLLSEHVIRRHSDVVGDSIGRSYVTYQWHNVPLLRTRALDTARLQDKKFTARSKILNNYPKL